MPNPVVHWELGSSDGAEVASFYADIFDGTRRSTRAGRAPTR